MKTQTKSKFPGKNTKTTKIVQEKPVRKISTRKAQTLAYNEENATWEVPKKLTGFQRPQVMKLEKIGDSIEGLYEGLQPVEYKKTSGIGAIMLLRQRNNTLLAVNAGYDIQRFLHESGFGELIGEWIRITLSSMVDTSNGQLAPMKQYEYEYSEEIIPKLQGGRNFTMNQLPMSKFASERLISDVSIVPKEIWEKESDKNY